MMATSTSVPNSMGVGPRQRRTKRRAQVPQTQGPWRDSSWVQSFSSQGPSPLGNPQELNPAFALRKIVLLLEKEKFIDVSQLINQLNNVTIKSIMHEIPMEMFIDNIPQSLVALESLYSKLFILDPENFPVDKLALEATVFQIVRHLALLDSMLDFGTNISNAEVMNSITNVLRIVLFVKPDIVSVVHARKKMMDNALLGIGEHSLVKVAGSLMNLHDGLKIEFEKTMASYKIAVQQLEQLSLSNPKPITLKSFANRSLPSANHQVLMTYTETEIQERLFKNKTVLNAVESNMTNQLPHLIQNLKERIENDKNALLAFGRLRREIKGISADAKVAPAITQYSKSLKAVLDIFARILNEEFPERKGKGLNVPDHEDQVLKLEEVEGRPVENNETQESNGNASSNLQNGSPYEDVPPPPSYPPPPIPQSESDPSSPRQESEKGVAKSPPSPKEMRRRGRSRDRSRRKRVGTSKGRPVSMDRSLMTISRPERESVEDNRDFQMMMRRINSVSASSPVERDQPLNDSRRSSSSSDAQKPVPAPRRSSRPTSIYVMGNAGPQTDEAFTMLMQESSKRESVEKERDRVRQEYHDTQEELMKTKEDLRLAIGQIDKLQETERRLNQEITRLSSRQAQGNGNHVIKSKRNIVGDLLYEYDKLFSNDRAEAWMSLKMMSEQGQFEDSDDLKDKVLFSVIVLAFRTSKNTLESIQGGVQQLLQVNPNKGRGVEDGNSQGRDNKVKEKISSDLLQFLRQLGQGYDLTPLIEEVSKQLFTALYDYPKLKTSIELNRFIERSVSLSWRLGIQDPPLTIMYDSMNFNPDMHQRAPGTNRKSSAVRSYLWPCLMEECTGQCVYRGVVIT